MKNCIKIPILNNEYFVVVTYGDKTHVEKVLKKNNFPKRKIKKLIKNSTGLCFEHKGCHPVIALPKRPKSAEEIATLAHEAVHAVKNIYDYIEQGDVDEIFCHSVGAVVRETLKKFK